MRDVRIVSLEMLMKRLEDLLGRDSLLYHRFDEGLRFHDERLLTDAVNSLRLYPEEIRQLGISFLLIDMTSPGVTVNPIITLDAPAEGFQEINMVYLEDVKVPKDNLVGEEGKGWTCAKYLLEFERGNAYSPGLKHALAQVKAMASREAGEELRTRIHDVEVQILAMEFTELRILGALAAGQNVGPESSMLKTRTLRF